MIFNHYRLCAIIIISALTSSTLLLARLTTLQHYDPIPVFSANDSMMPPNSQFLDLKQARFKYEEPSKRRVFGFNVSGFIQGSNRAKGYTGSTDFGTVVGIPENGFEMGDFRGTLYVMGLFLGQNPNNGYSIWANGVDNGDATNITDCSIRNFGLPSCLTTIAEKLSGNTETFPPATCTNTGPTAASALVFNSTTTASNIPSIFSQSALANDTKYFGAFSMPIIYRKQGLRLEMNVNFTDDIGLTIQSGIVNMKQEFTNTIATTVPNATGGTIGQTTGGPYSISNIQTACPSSSTGCTDTTISPLYQNLNFAAGPTAPPNSTAQALFNKYICNNLENILNPVCGHKQSLCSFDSYSLEDIRLILTLQHSYEPNHYSKKDHEADWPDMIFTPYIWGGGTFPVADTVNYNKLLALPFGNNGHASVGSGIGMTFDFAESVEVGVEGGITYFLSKNENRPFPTHPLQRILYPFNANVLTQPGINWHVKALLQAYQFLKHVSFWFTYELVEHRKDCFKVTDPAKKEYFYPSVLECQSDWRGQFFNAALVFDIQPGMQASFMWQQPISPRNAYYPVTIMGSLNFMF